MRGLARIDQDVMDWVEKDKPECGPYDAIVKPIAMAPCTSDVRLGKRIHERRAKPYFRTRSNRCR